jgi:hypothetical protein
VAKVRPPSPGCRSAKPQSRRDSKLQRVKRRDRSRRDLSCEAAASQAAALRGTRACNASYRADLGC